MSAPPAYSPADFALLAPVEESHFWFRSRRAVVERLVAGLDLGSPTPLIADLGCGTGEMLPALARAVPAGRVVGVDLFAEGLAVARRRGAADLVRGDAGALPFQARFDLACLLDVIEHLDDDAGALAAARSALRPGGFLLVTVPAHRWLWSEVDRQSGHRRRYSSASLHRLAEAQGLEVLFVAPYMSLLVPPLALKRLLLDRLPRRRRPVKDIAAELALPGPVNAVATALLAPERLMLGRRLRPPFGSSLVLLARSAPAQAQGDAETAGRRGDR